MWKGFMLLWLVLAVKYDDDGDGENYLWRALLKLEIVQHWFCLYMNIYDYSILKQRATGGWQFLDNIIKWIAIFPFIDSCDERKTSAYTKLFCLIEKSI